MLREYRYGYAAPVGALTLTCTAQGLTGLHFAPVTVGDGDRPAAGTRSAVAAQAALQRARDLPPAPAELPVLRQALRWLDVYFALPDGADGTSLPPLPPLLPLLPASVCGTVFQRRVWALLLHVPYGQTTTYGALARRLAMEDATARKRVCADTLSVATPVLFCPSDHPRRICAQAAGGAVGRNPLGIFIPCHRVVGAHGALTGFAGGLAVKRWLLRHEGATVGRTPV